MTSTRKLVMRLFPGKSWEEILIDAYETHGTVQKAADHIGVNELTYRKWLKEAGFKVEVKVTVTRVGTLVSTNAAQS